MVVHGSRLTRATHLHVMLVLLIVLVGCSGSPGGGGAASEAPSAPLEGSSAPTEAQTATPSVTATPAPTVAPVSSPTPAPTAGATTMTVTISGDARVAGTYTFNPDGAAGPPDAGGRPLWPADPCVYSAASEQWEVAAGRLDDSDPKSLEENIIVGLRVKSAQDATVSILFGNERSHGSWIPTSVFLRLPGDPPMSELVIKESGDGATIIASTQLQGNPSIPGTQMGDVTIDVQITADCKGVVRS